MFYINDLPLCCSDVHFILYADDTTSLVASELLQITCGKILNWLTSNKLVINVSKIKHMLLTLKGTSPPDVLLVDEHIELVRYNKFLGCIVDESFAWKEHVSSVCKKLARCIAMIRCAHMNTFFAKRLIYFAFIYPFFCCCLSI